MTDERVPWWGLLSSTAAPVLLIGGWTVAAARQPRGFDPVVDTISALAAHGATDRWIMTAALAGLGVCHAVTSLALRPAAPVGRWVLAGGGLATALVAALPLPADGSGSTAHVVAATAGFVALAAWPVFAGQRGAATPAVLRPAVTLPAAAVLLGLVGWFALEVARSGPMVGLSERVAAGAEALWPLGVVLGARAWRRGRR
ncbi:MAG: DUF998 domain-containing protein [Actinomycetes bacterium]